MSPKQGGQTQSSISSFFKRKLPPPTPTGDGDDAAHPVDLTSPPAAKRVKQLAGAEARRMAMLQSTSGYFTSGPRPNGSLLPGPPSSSSHHGDRSTLRSYALAPPPPSLPVASGSAFEQYTVNYPTRLSDEPRKRTAEQQKRHESWQRRMEMQAWARPRRRSLALDEAEDATGYNVAEDDGPPVDEVTIDSEEEARKLSTEATVSKLSAKFAAKGTTKSKKKQQEVGPSGLTYTPLEKQFMQIKAANPDVLLLMEVGYKYKFHGDDAKKASKELGIAAFPSRNFYTASIPTHRLHIHVKKLISLGYKVGVVSQTETAALKKIGENRNAPFTRELTHLFTAATYVEDSSTSSSNATDDPIVPGSKPPPTNALVAIVEKGLGGQVADDRVRIGLVSVVPQTGEVVWDEFDDSPVRSELETRLTHLQPSELLLPEKRLSKATEKVLSHFAGDTQADRVRIERSDAIAPYDTAFDYLAQFYNRKDGRPEPEEIDLTGNDDEKSPATTDDAAAPVDLASGPPAEEAVLALVDFPKQITIALCVAVKYMKRFGLQNVFRHRSSFTKFINRAHMLLSSNTLVNLEVYRNQTDGGLYGSLLWLLDHTQTRMGRRLMREWIGRPLLDVVSLRARSDAIDEIMNSNTYHMEKLRSLLVNMPDLVKGLTRIQYGKATPTEVATILVGLKRISCEFKGDTDKVFESHLLNTIATTLPTIRDTVQRFLGDISTKYARDNDEANLWNDPDKYPQIQDAKDCIGICESELDEHLKDVRQILKRPSLNYITVSGIEYLIEVPAREAKTVPTKWVKVSATKTAVRYHSPEILNITKERERHKETLAAVSRKALLSFQTDISECHSLVVVARQIAVIDCLMSLAQVAAASGYCKPSFVSEPCLHIRDGRHPMVEMLRNEAYVPFDIDFSDEDGSAKVITGPNMAGKSSCVRATALIVCMAQMGSFVPAASVTLGIHDSVQTRMGASDEIGRGKSTFMVELSETSDILRTLTPRTLVILDELGRGTSTYDGVAIAYATLSHVAGTGCNTLFVTHHLLVAEELAKEYPKQISNWHMSFEETKTPDGSAEITFLYKLTRGLAEASFGVWCARLAGLPKDVLDNAQLCSDILKQETERRREENLTRRTKALLGFVGVSAEPQLSGDDDGDGGTKALRPSSSAVLKNAHALYKALWLRESYSPS